VLYIDIRRSTELNFSHKPKTVAKLYTAFVRAMTRVARYHGGHVRGIIGDRVMVIFDSVNCFTNAVNCAIAMNTVARYIINERFKANEVACGIGIDAGKMLATKTGIRRHGVEQANYRNLVWLGRPANTASKLTDLANKPAETEEVKMVRAAYDKPTWGPSLGLLGALGGGLYAAASPSLGEVLRPSNPLGNALVGDSPMPYAPPAWEWKEETVEGFLSKLRVEYVPTRLVHNDASFASFYLTDETRVVRARTPPILMTARVWKGFRSEQPDSSVFKNGLIKRVYVKTPGYSDAVFGGDVIFPNLKD
jgi:adenylate cyclase